jgi:hypothetical protein
LVYGLLLPEQDRKHKPGRVSINPDVRLFKGDFSLCKPNFGRNVGALVRKFGTAERKIAQKTGVQVYANTP